MSAIAAVVNKAVADDKSIHLFFNTSKNQIGLSLQSGTGTDDQPSDMWAIDDDDYEGYILNPSFIAATYYRGLNFVAAVTKPNPDVTETENQISMVSPVYRRLAKSELENNTIALCATPDGDDGWLYYLE